MSALVVVNGRGSPFPSLWVDGWMDGWHKWSSTRRDGMLCTYYYFVPTVVRTAVFLAADRIDHSLRRTVFLSSNVRTTARNFHNSLPNRTTHLIWNHSTSPQSRALELVVFSSDNNNHHPTLFYRAI